MNSIYSKRDIALVFMTAFPLWICAEIEIRNYMLGSYMPVRIPDGQWRTSILTNEERWRKYHMESNERILSDEERIKMKKDIDRAVMRNSLQRWVSGPGVLQYILVPFIFIVSLCTVFTAKTGSNRIVSLSSLVSSILCGISLIYRDYIGALGW